MARILSKERQSAELGRQVDLTLYSECILRNYAGILETFWRKFPDQLHELIEDVHDRKEALFGDGERENYPALDTLAHRHGDFYGIFLKGRTFPFMLRVCIIAAAKMHPIDTIDENGENVKLLERVVVMLLELSQQFPSLLRNRHHQKPLHLPPHVSRTPRIEEPAEDDEEFNMEDDDDSSLRSPSPITSKPKQGSAPVPEGDSNEPPPPPQISQRPTIAEKAPKRVLMSEAEVPQQQQSVPSPVRSIPARQMKLRSDEKEDEEKAEQRRDSTEDELQRARNQLQSVTNKRDGPLRQHQQSTPKPDGDDDEGRDQAEGAATTTTQQKLTIELSDPAQQIVIKTPHFSLAVTAQAVFASAARSCSFSVDQRSISQVILSCNKDLFEMLNSA